MYWPHWWMNLFLKSVVMIIFITIWRVKVKWHFLQRGSKHSLLVATKHHKYFPSNHCWGLFFRSCLSLTLASNNFVQLFSCDKCPEMFSFLLFFFTPFKHSLFLCINITHKIYHTHTDTSILLWTFIKVSFKSS